jgi:hypothetical protein
LAFDLKIRTANRHIADQAVDPGAVERDCPGPYDILALGVRDCGPSEPPYAKAFKISLSRPLAFYARGNDHGSPIRCSRAFHKTTTATPPANASSTLVGKVSSSHSMEAFVRSSQPNRYDRFQARKSIALQQRRLERRIQRRIPCHGKPRKITTARTSVTSGGGVIGVSIGEQPRRLHC